MASPEVATQKDSLGWVESLHITDKEHASMKPVKQVRAVADEGLKGDRYLLGTGRYSSRAYSEEGRHATIIESEVLEDLSANTGLPLTAAQSRRNIDTRGVSLTELAGERFYIVEVWCEGARLCEPCIYLVELTGKPVLGPLIHKGGLRVHILRNGTIRRGDLLRNA